MGARLRKDLSRSRSALMRALKRAEEALESKDDATAIRAAHAIASVAGAILKLVEVANLEDRIQELEARVKELASARMGPGRKTA